MRRRAQRKPSHSRDPRRAAVSSAAYPRFPDRETWLPYGYRAELGSAFTVAELGFVPRIREDHAPYIADWLRVIRNDSKAILRAAAKASDALEYLSSFHQQSEAEAATADCAGAAERHKSAD
jgi:antirestriction protein ArdC